MVGDGCAGPPPSMRSDHACASAARSASRIVSVARLRACSAQILAADIRPPHTTLRDFVLFMTRLQRHPESQAMPLDDRFRETGLDEASIHGTGIMLVDSSFG